MFHIIVDFEMARDRRRGREHQGSEIIQFGAVKLNDAYETVSEFSRYVHPENITIDSDIEALTGISNEMVADAPAYAEALGEFLDWVGTDAFSIYSWSLTDYHQLHHESERKEVLDERVQKLLDHWVDFQEVFGKELGISHSLKLEYALKAANIDFEGKAHDGLTDARNTAHLFVLSRDREKFEKAIAVIAEMFRPKKRLSTSLGAFFPAGLDLPEGPEDEE